MNHSRPPTLIVLSGRPGVGKTTIARELARELSAIHLRIDSIEQRLRDAGWTVDGHGYAIAMAIASDNLQLGHTVIADCVNPWPRTRDEWRRTGGRAGARVVDVEIVCSDEAEHRRRVEARTADISGHVQPTWDQVVAHDYRPWTGDRFVVDTSGVTPAEAARAIAAHLSR